MKPTTAVFNAPAFTSAQMVDCALYLYEICEYPPPGTGAYGRLFGRTTNAAKYIRYILVRRWLSVIPEEALEQIPGATKRLAAYLSGTGLEKSLVRWIACTFLRGGAIALPPHLGGGVVSPGAITVPF